MPTVIDGLPRYFEQGKKVAYGPQSTGSAMKVPMSMWSELLFRHEAALPI
jgi:hypothetical protein